VESFQLGNALQTWPFSPVINSVLGDLPALAAVKRGGDGVAREVLSHF
jgi:hypothetical protein